MDALAFWGNLQYGEPFFILRGRDKLAAPLVSLWAELAALHDCPEDKVEEAQQCSIDMTLFAANRGGKWPD